MFNPLHPPPAPASFGKGKVLPQDQSSWLSRLVFQWISPFLAVGFTRPLEKDDLWELPPKRLTKNISDELETNFFSRCPPDDRPLFLREKSVKDDEKTSDTRSDTTDVEGKAADDTPSKTSKKSKYDSSLPKAILYTFRWSLIFSGLLKLASDTLKTTTPLVNKVLLTWLTESFNYNHANDQEKGFLTKPRGIGYGIGVAIAIFAMQEIASLMTNHFNQMTMATGLAVRTGLIGNIFRKSLRLSGRARKEHSVGQITTMISTDTTRLDRFCNFGHNLWVSPIQLAIGIGLLIGNLGYSALVGMGVLLISLPVQFYLVQVFFTQRKKGVKITDARVRLTTEVLQGIRLIKAYGWEDFYTEQAGGLRKREIKTIRIAAVARSVMYALVVFNPVLAAILSFITYKLTNHDLNVAIIFSSLQLFNIIRQPLIMLPVILSALADAGVALRRIGSYLTAEELDEPYAIAQDDHCAVDVDGEFTWETAGRLEGARVQAPKGGKKGVKGAPPTTGSKSRPSSSAGDPEKQKQEEEKPFELRNLKFTIPKGAFVAIIGRVGSGKSSILQALIGEMRRTKGHVTFGGTVAYVPQTPWIRNATLKENIMFGLKEDDDKFHEVIRSCSLEHDLEMLPDGEDTEIGEKGINLSGGQKARVSLARAAYSPSDVILLDDPLSAVDSYVGKAILNDCLINGPLAKKTRILVTHALHVLDKADYILVVDQGEIKEQGTFEDLKQTSTLFSRLLEDYGSMEQKEDKEGDKNIEVAIAKETTPAAKKVKTLMQQEERNTGAVTWAIYLRYFSYAGGIFWAPLILLLLVLSQAASVGNNLFLGFWSDNSIAGFSQGQYMAIYAGLGVASAVFQFMTSMAFAMAGLFASLRLFRSALRAVLRSPVSFFDTTPIGRVLSRLSKDQDTLDQELTSNLYSFLSTFSGVLGTIALVFYTLPYLGIIFVPLTILYYIAALYYRRSSVETKRLDSLMRSALYSSYSETLTGLATIRAYGEQNRAVKDAQEGLDMENRAYYMTITIQRWLGVRLDFLGNILVLGIGLFAAGFRDTVSPAKIGVVLSYTLSITQVFSDMVSQFAQQEQSMNAVERILTYIDLPSEGNIRSPNDPPPSWPEKGEIDFKDVELTYRPGLPMVLKDVSFHINAGEKIGVVGRTGAGKSSLLQALLRLVEIQSGKIEIDGVNTAAIGLQVLRERLALVPQDSTLFLGTLRENIDPMGTRTDAELISALQRSWLLPKTGPVEPAVEAKFSLDSAVGDEGSNFSAGEKQLLALCRALVKDSRVIILDEATSNVDVETDAKVQQTIQTEFTSSTLICIAHRLNTIAYYDRILVMDGGKVAEFDTVLNLFDKEDSIFRSLCNEASLQRADIVRIRSGYHATVDTTGQDTPS